MVTTPTIHNIGNYKGKHFPTNLVGDQKLLGKHFLQT